ncbi:helix-turn-helix transcriptional regulator [Thermophilibacter sp.]
MDIGNQIRERRQALGLSQEELAQRLYVSRVTVSHWETDKTLPDVQSMLLLANLFGTTIDELVRGDVDEMREMVEKGERRTKAYAIALGAVEVTVIAVLAIMATVGRDYLEPVLRLLLAVLVLASSLVALAARKDAGVEGASARSVAELLGAATGAPAEASQESAAAHAMRLVLQVFAGLVAGIGVLVAGGLLLDRRAFVGLAVVVGAAAAFAVAHALGRHARPTWTAAILPTLWVGAAVALAATTGVLAVPQTWFAIVGGAVTLLIFWVDGRRRD